MIQWCNKRGEYVWSKEQYFPPNNRTSVYITEERLLEWAEEESSIKILFKPNEKLLVCKMQGYTKMFSNYAEQF